MENFEDILKYIVYFLVWVISGLLNFWLKQAIQIAGRSSRTLTKNATVVLDSGQSQLGDLDIEYDKVREALGNFFNSLLDGIKSLDKALTNVVYNMFVTFDERQFIVKEPRNSEGGDNLSVEEAAKIEKDLEKGLQDRTKTIFQDRFFSQRILGATLEFVALIVFLYSDAAQGANNLTLLFPDTEVPSFLTNITIPIIAASAGSALILGIFIADFLKQSRFSSWHMLEGRTRTVFFSVVVANLIAVILLSTFLALLRLKVFDANSGTYETLAAWAQSLIIAPLLITTALLHRGVFGIFIVVAFFCLALRIPLWVITLVLGALLDLLAQGSVLLGNLVKSFIRFLLMITSGIFFVLDVITNGLFVFLLHLLNAILRIPHYLLIRFMPGFEPPDASVQIDSYELDLFDLSNNKGRNSL